MTHGYTSTDFWTQHNLQWQLCPPGTIYLSNSIEVMIIIEGPRPRIDPGTSCPQTKHANNFTNGDVIKIVECIPIAINQSH